MATTATLQASPSTEISLLSFYCPVTGIIFGQLAAFGSSELNLPLLPLAHCLSLELLRAKMLLRSNQELTEGLTQNELAGILQAELLLTFPPLKPVYSPTGLNTLLACLPKGSLLELSRRIQKLRSKEQAKLRSILPSSLNLSKGWLVEGLQTLKQGEGKAETAERIAERMLQWLETLIVPPSESLTVEEAVDQTLEDKTLRAGGRVKGEASQDTSKQATEDSFSLDLSCLLDPSAVKTTKLAKPAPTGSLAPLSSKTLCLKLREEQKHRSTSDSPLLNKILQYWKEGASAPTEVCTGEAPKKIERHLVEIGYSPELAQQVRKKLLDNQWQRENQSPFASEASNNPLLLVQKAIEEKLKGKGKKL